MILTANNIHKTYRQGADLTHVLRGVNFDIAQGEVVAIIGPSGAGKSTLLHILGGLDKPTEGSVNFNGKDLYQISDGERAKIRNNDIGFVFQFYHLLPELNALENVLLPALVQNNLKATKSLELEGLKLLEQVGLGHRLKNRPNQLSGGEQQRVAIARALMNKPKIIFCDEPTGNLDSQSGAVVIDLLLGLNKQLQQTLVIVTHDEAIAKRTNKIHHIRDGKILETKGVTKSQSHNVAA